MTVGSKLIALLSTSSPLRPFTVYRLARYSRHPFAANSSAAVFHGRLYSFFNRPKLGIWNGAEIQFHSQTVINEGSGEAATLFSDSKNSHPWTEWSKLADLLVEKGNSDRCIACGDDDDSFLVVEDLPEQFLKAAEACLGFARDRPDILRLLAKKNIEAVVLNGSPFLFKNGENSARRMEFFLTGEGSSVSQFNELPSASLKAHIGDTWNTQAIPSSLSTMPLQLGENQQLELEKAQTIDIMRYLLSYVYGHLPSSDANDGKSDELVERYVRKLLCELFNLSGTVWKPKSVDATLAELPLSNEQLSGHPGQYIETKSGGGIYPNIPGRSSAASENQPNAYGKSVFFNQKQGPEETPSSQTMSNCDAQPSAGILDKNVESWNRVQTSSTSNAQLSNETTAAYASSYSGQPSSHLGNNYNTFNGGKPTQPSGNSWSNSTTTCGGSMAKPSTPSANSWNKQRTTSYEGHNVNSTQQSSNPSNNSNTFYDNYNTSLAGYNVNSAQPSSPLRSNGNTPYGGTTENSSQPPPSHLWSNYNSANSTQPSGNSWSDNSRFYGESSPNSSQPPSGYQGNYSTQYDGHSNASQTRFTSNSSHQPPSDSWNTYNASPGGFNENLKHPSSNSYSAYSPQPPNNSWNNYNTPSGENAMKSTQPSSNYWNNRNTNTVNYTAPSTSSRNADNSYVGFNADSYRRYPANSNSPSSFSWNNSSTSYAGASTNPPQLSSSTCNNSSSGGLPQASNGLPSHAQTQNAGYSGKSLEGSCVTQPDPLDMSEEAKAERWFRRAAQIKDISELSQIPDEDFPQIMPMRKGVNRFVVSKRKTPLERRLASQQYKRSLPVVSSEPDQKPIAGEKEV